MALPRMDHVSVVVDDMPAAIAYFTELGLESQGEQRVEGEWVDRINNIDGLQIDIVMMRTPDGAQLELTRFLHPALVPVEPKVAPPNALGLRSVMFEVADIDDMVERLRPHGGALIGEIVRYENYYRLCYLRGPGDIIVSLAQSIG